MNSLLLEQMYFMNNPDDERAEKDYRETLGKYYYNSLISKLTFETLLKSIENTKESKSEYNNHRKDKDNIKLLDDYKIHDTILHMSNDSGSSLYLDKAFSGQAFLGIYEKAGDNVSLYTASREDLELLRSTLNDILGES